MTDNIYEDVIDNLKDETVEAYFKAVHEGNVSKVKDFLKNNQLLAIEVDD